MFHRFKNTLDTGCKLAILPFCVDKKTAIIRRRNIISRTITVTIRTDAKLPMTALATQEDPAPSKSVLSIVVLHKIEK